MGLVESFGQRIAVDSFRRRVGTTSVLRKDGWDSRVLQW